jgi:hypothetical protein
LPSNLKEKRTGETACRNSGDSPADRYRILDFRRNDLETQYRRKRVRQQRDEDRTQRGNRQRTNIVNNLGDPIKHPHKSNDPDQQHDRDQHLDKLDAGRSPRRLVGACTRFFFVRPSFTSPSHWS